MYFLETFREKYVKRTDLDSFYSRYTYLRDIVCLRSYTEHGKRNIHKTTIIHTSLNN